VATHAFVGTNFCGNPAFVGTMFFFGHVFCGNMGKDFLRYNALAALWKDGKD
jgi:hypothetical protein